MPKRLLGITVLGDFVLSEGVDSVIANLKRIGATAVATNPTVTAAAEEGEGSFQPPVDAGSSPRVFDRPLFGKNALWVRSGVSYVPDESCYADSPYRPRQPNDLTEQHGAIIGEFLRAAKDAGMQVYLQLGAVQPSGLRDEDRPRLPNGTIPPDRMADTGSLASEAIREYNRAYVRDLLQQYPEVDGFRPDWPEYPCYTLGEVFQDFGTHVERWAGERGFDFAAMRDGVGALYETLIAPAPQPSPPQSGRFGNEDGLRGRGGLSNDLLKGFDDGDALAALRRQLSVVDDWLQFKAALSADCLKHWRSILTEAGGAEIKLSANAFMPRYSDVTGFDFAAAAEICDAVSPKLYTMHWSQMVEFWGRPLLDANPSINESLLTAALARLMQIDDAPDGKTLADFGYPAPDEPHQIADEPQRRKIADVIETVGEQCTVTPLVHGYGPTTDFRRRLQLVAESDADGIWINRYGYLGDDKLDAIADVCAE